MSAEVLKETPLVPPSSLGPYRRRDYDELPEQPRCELLLGRLYVTPSPTPPHQTATGELWSRLRQIAKTSGGRAYIAPLDVVLADHTIVQPDVIYISAARLEIVGKRIEGAPDLLVEVLSPGTAQRDRVYKRDYYARSGIREYWIVDVKAKQIEFLVNQGGRFAAASPEQDVYRSREVPEIQLDVADFWRSIEPELGS